MKCYETDLSSGKILPDPSQRMVVQGLQALYEELNTRIQAPKSWWNRLSAQRFQPSSTAVKGMYLWGGVGLGKTYLMDRFYECLPNPYKRRLHFHRFMRWIHDQLKTVRGGAKPIKRITERLPKNTQIICLDELYVSDIGDAMILARLLESMFENGITLVTTSNRHPDDLYKNGLQRARFLPAIELLKTHTKVIELKGNTDYRLNFLDKADIYHTPIDTTADEVLMTNFLRVAPDEGSPSQTLEVEGRAIDTVRTSEGVVWFDFEALCNGPRSSADYIEIARCFNTVLISNIPIMGQDNDIARRFVTAIDEFYDRNVKIIASAAAPPNELYRGKKLAFEFQRTASRLTEMQTHDYLAKEHLC